MTPAGPSEPIEVVLPVHNEAASIETTLREFHAHATQAGLTVSFRACEDGSSDGTQDILHRLEGELPLVADCASERRGYSKAVVDGLRSASAPVIGFIDSDGQCDPADLPKLVAALPGHDIVFGYRHPRVDPVVRKVMSGAFGTVFRLFFPVKRKDPSCPYLLVRRECVPRALAGNPGILRQGFWWEFSARAQAAGLKAVEVPVHHRARASGTTQVYKPAKVPRIAAEHLAGLVSLRKDIARYSS